MTNRPKLQRAPLVLPSYPGFNDALWGTLLELRQNMSPVWHHRETGRRCPTCRRSGGARLHIRNHRLRFQPIPRPSMRSPTRLHRVVALCSPMTIRLVVHSAMLLAWHRSLRELTIS